MSRAKGNASEDTACEYLKSLQYRIVERNYYSKFGEIDIIAFKEGVFHFVEVKSGEGFEPVYNLTPSKLSKIIKTANHYIAQHSITQAYSFDAIIIRQSDVEFLENITM